MFIEHLTQFQPVSEFSLFFVFPFHFAGSFLGWEQVNSIQFGGQKTRQNLRSSTNENTQMRFWCERGEAGRKIWMFCFEIFTFKVQNRSTYILVSTPRSKSHIGSLQNYRCIDTFPGVIPLEKKLDPIFGKGTQWSPGRQIIDI